MVLPKKTPAWKKRAKSTAKSSYKTSKRKKLSKQRKKIPTENAEETNVRHSGWNKEKQVDYAAMDGGTIENNWKKLKKFLKRTKKKTNKTVFFCFV